jgi:hypothetical protein
MELKSAALSYNVATILFQFWKYAFLNCQYRISPAFTEYNTTITILDIIHRPVFYSKQYVSEIGFCPRRLSGDGV